MEIQTCVKSRITKSNLPITKGKDQVLKFHSHTGLISWQISMMHCSSHDGGGATGIVKGEVELHSARSKVVHDSNEDNGQLFFTVNSGGSRGGSVGSMEPPFKELPSFNSQCA